MIVVGKAGLELSAMWQQVDTQAFKQSGTLVPSLQLDLVNSGLSASAGASLRIAIHIAPVKAGGDEFSASSTAQVLAADGKRLPARLSSKDAAAIVTTEVPSLPRRSTSVLRILTEGGGWQPGRDAVDVELCAYEVDGSRGKQVCQCIMPVRLSAQGASPGGAPVVSNARSFSLPAGPAGAGSSKLVASLYQPALCAAAAKQTYLETPTAGPDDTTSEQRGVPHLSLDTPAAVSPTSELPKRGEQDATGTEAGGVVTAPPPVESSTSSGSVLVETTATSPSLEQAQAADDDDEESGGHAVSILVWIVVAPILVGGPMYMVTQIVRVMVRRFGGFDERERSSVQGGEAEETIPALDDVESGDGGRHVPVGRSLADSC
eukprot:TRINITY_DN14185_c0_g1_i3.p1 TRINITY_DN14185_c0_g1~~TRINITY_DN14185_c0_g1_i3.p1  ORF type:complete len:376 (-),score=61.27 TRINITY_DN14185_c0_g1_i3:42-1169(-)